MKAGSGGDTWHLATSRLEIVSDRKARVALRTLLGSVLLALGILAGLRLYTEAAGPVAHASALAARNASLDAELARLRADLELQRATRAALEQQVVELEARASQLASELNFVKAQGGRSGAGQARD